MASVVLSIVFLPAFLPGTEGDIGVFVPWWIAAIGWAANADVGVHAGVFVLTILLSPLVWLRVDREIRRHVGAAP
jgi:hypothetical protein